ncbi:TetR/AcrR family transcriptional regulator [Herbaspirillum sp. VT-16-41]|uniref:TetR/AcrR family transcriptional regulator n=1 Tax=Herbaspirillum sp. VT-16-41 TaxID=1953765 RepID=UPI000981919A|nr:TetR/AcrR family transcriptional regulator [Herbaspirillum sp. VT-16-41]ONN64906.1 TetR family transcriptional regulator [Herbaspirillum sp. VT-16-41]
MSGKPQYDESAVLEAAMRVFWQRGYAATSINDLLAETGLSRSSIYQRFQDKGNLFREVLALYTERVLRRMLAIERASERARMEAVLRDFLPKPSATRRPDGCLLARSCTEIAILPEDSQIAVEAGVARQHAVLEQIISKALSNGELPASSDRHALAWYYLGILHAVMTLPQVGAVPAALSGMIDLAMASWPVGRSARAT